MRMRLVTRTFCVLFVLMVSLPGHFWGQDKGVLGFWKEPGGSVIHVEKCEGAICATLVAISPSAPSRVDSKNPDHDLQHRSLCGLRIGEGFHLTLPTKADGGTLYDPKSGKTYHGTMTSSGDELNLRGYVGISLFGRTERWSRTGEISPCRS